MYKTFALELRPPIAEIAVTSHSIDGAFLAELSSAVQRIADDDSLRVLLLTGEKDAFAPGYGDAAGGSPFREIELMSQPVIAVIEGAAEGAGLALALACDVRIASDGATFAFTETASGVVTAFGVTQRLPRLIGRARAAQMLIAGERVDAATAHAWGLVNAVAARGAAKADAERIAASICVRGPLAVRYAKEAIARGLDMPLDQALRYETDLTVILQTTEDRAEGVRAFLEKRTPRFEGR